MQIILESGIETNKRTKEKLIGKVIQDVDYDGLYSARMAITFTDGSVLDIDGVGDDMSHTEIYLNGQSI